MPDRYPLSALSPTPTGLDEDYLRDVFRQAYQAEHDAGPEAMPSVAHPAIFQKDPIVVDTPANARHIYQTIARIAPMYLSQVKLVSRAPTTASMDLMTASGMGLTRTTGTTLYGASSPSTGQIFLAPDAPYPLQVLIHELLHHAGGSERRVRDQMDLAGANKAVR